MIDQQAIAAAIEALQDRYMTVSMCITSTECKAHNRAIDTALAALRECAERREGCEYCLNRFEIASHHINEAGLQAGTKKKATHCPVCGRKLERSDT